VALLNYSTLKRGILKKEKKICLSFEVVAFPKEEKYSGIGFSLLPLELLK